MIDIYADGADYETICRLATNPLVAGFTTNPTLMRKAGVTDYSEFANKVLEVVPPDKPVSFEVFADDFEEMERQALLLASWGSNVYVKIPVTDSKGFFTGSVIRALSAAYVQLNITAVFTPAQSVRIVDALRGAHAIISVFAGRIADTGKDPVHIINNMTRGNASILWASTRELFNVQQAESAGCDIITMSADMIDKYVLLSGKDLSKYSLETVQDFRKDAIKAGYKI